MTSKQGTFGIVSPYLFRIKSNEPTQKYPGINQTVPENEDFDLAKLDSKDLLRRSLRHSSDTVKCQNNENNTTNNNISNNVSNTTSFNDEPKIAQPKGPFKITISELGKE